METLPISILQKEYHEFGQAARQHAEFRLSFTDYLELLSSIDWRKRHLYKFALKNPSGAYEIDNIQINTQ